ncbi:cofilin, partial [Tilletia horrida]
MSSGIGLNAACIENFQQLKLGKKLKYVTYRISDDKSEIIVEKTSEDADWDSFVATLPENECRWAVYDFAFEKEGEGQRNKIVFISWAPDTAPVRAKMIAASSKDALRRALVGIGAEIQATEFAEIDRAA